MPALTSIEVPEPVLAIVRRLEEAGHEAWCVGGALRDTVLRLPHADVDVATAATPDQVRRLFRRTVAVGERHGTIGVLDDDGSLHEVTTFRRDVRTDGRHAVVEFGASLDEDLARRDFTINALAYHPLRQEWRDPFGGAADLDAGLIRAVGDPAERFHEDYLRILRALRFAARFGFAIEDATWSALVANAPALVQLSAERIRDEWFKSLRTAITVTSVVALWHRSGAATVVLPGLTQAPPAEPGLSAPPREPVLLTAALVASPAIALDRLHCSNSEVARASAIAMGPSRPDGADDVAVRRWLSEVGEAADDLTRMEEWRNGAPAPWRDAMARIRHRGDPLRREELAVRGGDLLALGLAGPAVGVTLGRLLDRVLEDPALNTRAALLALARGDA
jgi:tRNA nucleotidyltransferase (CCA-adding enzyme)